MSPPDTLYHYTTPAGLLGILDSSSIWATKIFYLNDASEFTTAIEIAVRQLQAFREKAVSKQAQFELGVFSSQLKVIAHLNVFVVSLTEEGDQLSQWRAYSGSHSGFSIAFNSRRLSGVASQHGFSLGQCIYDERAHQDRVAQLIDDCIADRALPTPMKDFGVSMLQLAPLLKHPSFSDEREWRLVSLPIYNDVRFRTGPSTIIPYYQLPTIAPDGKSCVSGIIIGPTPHPELAIESVRSLVDARGLAGVPVHGSKIPLRTW